MKKDHRDYKNKVVLITGGSGFIGNHLIEVLLKYKAKIHVFDKKIAGKKNVSGKLYWHRGDIQNKKSLKEIVAKTKPDYIFHLAALLGSKRDLGLVEKMIKINFLGTLSLLDALQNTKFKKFVFIGTCEEYGTGATPFKENQATFPISPYSLSKIAATNLCLLYSKIFNYPIVVLRPTVVYGPGQRKIMFIPSLIKSLIKNEHFEMTRGEQKRDFIYVKDLVEAILMAGLKKEVVDEIINVGSGKSYTLKRVVALVKNLTKSQSKISLILPYRPLEIMNYSTNISKAKKMLGWKPKWSLKEGLEETINYYKSER